MKITRDVITDLLPLYLAGEASEDTHTLVEDFFRQDPEFERLARQGQTNLGVLEMSSMVTANPAAQQEKETLMRVKRILRLRSILMGAALFCTAMPFSFGSFEEGAIWFMARDMPGLAAGFAVGAVLAWVAYIWTFRVLRDTA